MIRLKNACKTFMYKKQEIKVLDKIDLEIKKMK